MRQREPYAYIYRVVNCAKIFSMCKQDAQQQLHCLQKNSRRNFGPAFSECDYRKGKTRGSRRGKSGSDKNGAQNKRLTRWDTRRSTEGGIAEGQWSAWRNDWSVGGYMGRYGCVASH